MKHIKSIVVAGLSLLTLAACSGNTSSDNALADQVFSYSSGGTVTYSKGSLDDIKQYGAELFSDGTVSNEAIINSINNHYSSNSYGNFKGMYFTKTSGITNGTYEGKSVQAYEFNYCAQSVFQTVEEGYVNSYNGLCEYLPLGNNSYKFVSLKSLSSTEYEAYSWSQNAISGENGEYTKMSYTVTDSSMIYDKDKNSITTVFSFSFKSTKNSETIAEVTADINMTWNKTEKTFKD